jgi:hypothetical protein
MHKKAISSALAAMIVTSLPSLATPAYAQTSDATHAGHYSVTTTPVGTLLDDPAATAILKELIPTVYANDMFQTMGRPQTLKAIQQYEPEALSDEVLARIQAAFDKLPPKE